MLFSLFIPFWSTFFMVSTYLSFFPALSPILFYSPLDKLRVLYLRFETYTLFYSPSILTAILTLIFSCHLLKLIIICIPSKEDTAPSPLWTVPTLPFVTGGLVVVGRKPPNLRTSSVIICISTLPTLFLRWSSTQV